MAVGGIDSDHIHPGGYEGFDALNGVGCNANGRTGEQTPVAVFTSQGMAFHFFDVFEGDETF